MSSSNIQVYPQTFYFTLRTSPFRPFCVRCPCSYFVTLRHLKPNSCHNNNNYLSDEAHYIESLLFQNNPHKLTLVMTAEEDYDRKCRDVEMRKLMEKLSPLLADEKENIFKTGNIVLLSSFRANSISV